MEICQDCGLPMKGRETVWLETKSEVYFSLDPFCAACAKEREQQVRKDACARAYAVAAGRSGDQAC